MAHLKKSKLINAPFDKVHSIARDPKRWAEWYVGLSEPEKITGEGGPGTAVEQSYLLMGLKFPITNRVLEDRSGKDGATWKGKMEGPLAGEQTVTFKPKNGGTEVTIDLEYTVPGKLLGKIADRLIIERMMERNTDNTLENLNELCVKEPVHA